VSVIAVLIGFSMLVAGGFLIAFLWAVRSGQFDDRHTPSIRMLFDDTPNYTNNKPKVSKRDR
jgi:cbb3-type cytochrome oxidase maturation protein